MNEIQFLDYSFNLDAMTKYCCIGGDISNKKNNEFRQQEISNNYQLNDNDDLVLSEKIVHEVVTPQDTPIYDTLKTDLVKGLLSVILEEKEVLDDKGVLHLSIPARVALQTFFDYGFLKINNKK